MKITLHSLSRGPLIQMQEKERATETETERERKRSREKEGEGGKRAREEIDGHIPKHNPLANTPHVDRQRVGRTDGRTDGQADIQTDRDWF